MCLAGRPALPSIYRAGHPAQLRSPFLYLIAHHCPTQPGECATEAKDVSHALYPDFFVFTQSLYSLSLAPLSVLGPRRRSLGRTLLTRVIITSVLAFSFPRFAFCAQILRRPQYNARPPAPQRRRHDGGLDLHNTRSSTGDLRL